MFFKFKYITILIFIVVVVLIFIFFGAYTENRCYNRCSDFHYMSESSHWEYNEYIFDGIDTIWIDKECYNSWCACIDECKLGLCCDHLK